MLQVNLLDELEPLVVRGGEVGQKSHQAVLVDTDQGRSRDIVTTQSHKIQNLPSSPSRNKEKSKSKNIFRHICVEQSNHIKYQDFIAGFIYIYLPILFGKIFLLSSYFYRY